MKILSIESSCDETSCAVIEDGRKCLSNIVSSQIDIHTRFGGVVPEIASRNHTEAISSAIFKVRELDYPNASKEETTAYVSRTIRRILNLVRDNDYNYVFFK